MQNNFWLYKRLDFDSLIKEGPLIYLDPRELPCSAIVQPVNNSLLIRQWKSRKEPAMVIAAEKPDPF